MKNRRNLIRISLIIVLIFISLLLFLFGKQHEVFVDNKTIEINGTQYLNIDKANIKIDDGEYIEVEKRKRKKLITVGPYHTITLQYTNEKGQTIILEEKINLGFKGDIIINIPALINNKEFLSYK
jgi:hypothetical protein